MKNLDEAIKILLAAQKGQAIEYFDKEKEEWVSTASFPKINLEVFLMENIGTLQFRIVKQLKYRPYKDMREFLKACILHGGYIYWAGDPKTYYPQPIIDNDKLYFNTPSGGQPASYSLKDLSILCRWADDNSPCGVKD